MNKVLIIDDDKELCALIKRSVLSEDIEADFCNTGKEGLQKLKEREYQLVILDVMMPGMDGFETLEEIRKESSLPILMFTSKNDSASKVRGLRAGADDYLTKPFDMDELIARIVSLIRRYTRFNQQDGISQQLEFDGLKIDIENRSVTTENGTFELPPKEFDLLLYCAKNQGKILTKQQIYEEVWREEYFYDDSNIMAIISRLRKKLEVNPGPFHHTQLLFQLHNIRRINRWCQTVHLLSSYMILLQSIAPWVLLRRLEKSCFFFVMYPRYSTSSMNWSATRRVTLSLPTVRSLMDINNGMSVYLRSGDLFIFVMLMVVAPRFFAIFMAWTTFLDLPS